MTKDRLVQTERRESPVHRDQLGLKVRKASKDCPEKRVQLVRLDLLARKARRVRSDLKVRQG